MESNTNNSTSLSISLDTSGLKKSWQDAEKLSNDAAKKIAKNVTSQLDKIDFSKLTEGLNKLDVSKISGTISRFSKKLDNNFGTALQKINPEIQKFNQNLLQTAKVMDTLSSISKNFKGFNLSSISNIGNVGNLSSRSRVANSASSMQQQLNSITGVTKNSGTRYTGALGSSSYENSAYGRLFYGNGADMPDIQNMLSNYRIGRESESSAQNAMILSSEKMVLAQQYELADKLGLHKGVMNFINDKHNIGGKSASAKSSARAFMTKGYDKYYDKHFTEQEHNSHNPSYDEWESFLNTKQDDIGGFDFKEFFHTEDKQQKKRGKAEDKFIGSITKVASLLTGIYGVNSVVNKVGNAIIESSRLNKLSQYTGEDASRLFLYNEAIKRTTHADSYDQLEGLRTRIINSALQGDPNMTSILGITKTNASEYNSVTKILDKIRNSEALHTDVQRQAFMMQMGLNPDTAMALSKKDQFNKDLDSVSKIGGVTQAQVEDAKQLLNVWEDINQQSKLFVAGLLPLLLKVSTGILDGLKNVNEQFTHTGKEDPKVDQAYKKYLDKQSWFDKSFHYGTKVMTRDQFYNNHFALDKSPVTYQASNKSPFMDTYLDSLLDAENSKRNPNAEAHGYDSHGNLIGAYGMYQMQPATAAMFESGIDGQRLKSDPKKAKELAIKFAQYNENMLLKKFGWSKEDGEGKHAKELSYAMYLANHHGVGSITQSDINNIKRGNFVVKDRGKEHGDRDFKISIEHKFENAPDGVNTQHIQTSIDKWIQDSNKKQNMNAIYQFATPGL